MTSPLPGLAGSGGRCGHRPMDKAGADKRRPAGSAIAANLGMADEGEDEGAADDVAGQCRQGEVKEVFAQAGLAGEHQIHHLRGADDDVREAAQRETDPELRARLWDEYRAYKRSQ